MELIIILAGKLYDGFYFRKGDVQGQTVIKISNFKKVWSWAIKYFYESGVTVWPVKKAPEKLKNGRETK